MECQEKEGIIIMVLKSYRLKLKKSKKKTPNLLRAGVGLVGLAIGLSAIKAAQR